MPTPPASLSVPGSAVPLIVGLGKGENFIASDVSAIVSHTTNAVYLQDRDLVYLTEDEFTVENVDGDESAYEVSKIDFTPEQAEIGDFPHFMLKEIYEQPNSLRNAMRGRLSRDECTAVLGGLNMTPRELAQIDRIILAGCGTAYHAAMVGEYLIERSPACPPRSRSRASSATATFPANKNTLLFVMSQSGETIDTLAAMREGQRKGIRCLGIVNTVGSTIARESDGGVYIHAGPEIGVAATKTFTSQVTILTLLSLLLGRIHHLSSVGWFLRDDRPARGAAGQDRHHLEAGGQDQGHRRKARACGGHAVPRAPGQLPRGARRRAEDEGDQLHLRQRPSQRRAETRRHRLGEAGHAERLHRA
jgi:glucosamine 6-phosphate synthetase-like amidotransferase/phosphosugar isomerase protein